MNTENKHEIGIPTKPYQIYLLIDPRDKQPIYVGKARCAITRLGGHLRRHHENPKLGAVIQELKELLLVPNISILDTGNKYEIDSKEKYWIKHYLNLYPNLCNIANTVVHYKKTYHVPVYGYDRYISSEYLEESLL